MAEKTEDSRKSFCFYVWWGKVAGSPDWPQILYVVQLPILLSLLPECWDYTCIQSCLVYGVLPTKLRALYVEVSVLPTGLHPKMQLFMDKSSALGLASRTGIHLFPSDDHGANSILWSLLYLDHLHRYLLWDPVFCKCVLLSLVDK